MCICSNIGIGYGWACAAIVIAASALLIVMMKRRIGSTICGPVAGKRKKAIGSVRRQGEA